MSKKRRSTGGSSVAEVCRTLDRIAPPALAQDWDNVGLLAGDIEARVRRVLLCIDLTPAVVQEAVKHKAGLVMAYHPPIFKPIARLRVPSSDTDEAVFRCIRAGIAVYSMHTALDAADGGTNDVIASLCGIKQTEPIEYRSDPNVDQRKIVTFLPEAHLESVTNAMFAAGAGRIGDYTHCSYRLDGTGSFKGGESTNPVIGKRGTLETVDEVRVEMVVSAADLPAVVRALHETHPYEEPAFDIYPVQGRPVRSMGRQGELPRATKLAPLARKLKKATGARCVQIVGDHDHPVQHAVIVVGAAGNLPFRIPLTERHVIITGEIRHHDALAIHRRGCVAIALGHCASERPVLGPLAERIGVLLPGIDVRQSETDREPFTVP